MTSRVWMPWMVHTLVLLLLRGQTHADMGECIMQCMFRIVLRKLLNSISDDIQMQ